LLLFFLFLLPCILVNKDVYIVECYNVECCFDIVLPKTATLSKQQATCFDNVVSTLLLVWTRLKQRSNCGRLRRVTAVDGRNVLSTVVDRDRTCANAGTVSKM